MSWEILIENILLLSSKIEMPKKPIIIPNINIKIDNIDRRHIIIINIKLTDLIDILSLLY